MRRDGWRLDGARESGKSRDGGAVRLVHGGQGGTTAEREAEQPRRPGECPGIIRHVVPLILPSAAWGTGPTKGRRGLLSMECLPELCFGQTQITFLQKIFFLLFSYHLLAEDLLRAPGLPVRTHRLRRLVPEYKN